jgi:archaellum component FlaF (FlaF/FlaG flagellin family)
VGIVPHKHNQKGFAAVESLLILIIIAALVGVGAYVWRAQKQTNATLDAASKAAQSSHVTHDATDLSNTLASDPGKHVQVQVPKGWTATTLHGAGSGQCSFADASQTVENSCLINMEISSDAKPDTLNFNYKIFKTTDNISAWRTGTLGTKCNEAKTTVNGYSVSFCAADNTQSFSDYVVSDGHYLAYLESNGTSENAQLNKMVHSLKFND